MGSIVRHATVDAPVGHVYAYWRNFTNFPKFMPHVREVTPIDDGETWTRWRVAGPLGQTAEWNARVVEEVPNEKIAWASDEDSKVRSSGVVRFDSRNGHTNVQVSLEYDHAAGGSAAKLFEDPERQVEDALGRFAQIARTWSERARR